MKLLLLLMCAGGLAGCTSIQSRIEIAAPAEKVRSAVFKFEDYPAWNPFIVKVDGTVAEGNQVDVTVKPVGKAEISGKTEVITKQDNLLVWHGRLAIPGIFSGVHEFRIEVLEPNRTAFINNEKMSGLIVPFYDFNPTAAGFNAMNEALKKRVESP